ncbi:hypothetical protein L3X38_019087 [Prunus dulcis]|uniref:Uncharacterized protein n=1 Tax=Prunus dulcis TaxID=3755 RepID=A0AAD4WA88_PRUDU|nr:hypothetical protein L3X38_019087 [Prunus dulcis]
MDYVPVMLEWSLFHSTTDVYGTFFEPKLTTIYGSHQPYCRSYYDSSSINESSRLECSCRRGYKGNPYLLDRCQGLAFESFGRCLAPRKCVFLRHGRRHGCLGASCFVAGTARFIMV